MGFWEHDTKKQQQESSNDHDQPPYKVWWSSHPSVPQLKTVNLTSDLITQSWIWIHPDHEDWGKFKQDFFSFDLVTYFGVQHDTHSKLIAFS